MKDKLLIIIPACDEEKTISGVIGGCKKHLPGAEVLVVDDGSEDKTAEVVKEAGIKVLSHAFNLGKGAALKTGCLWGLKERFKVFAFIDGDGQHSPKDLAKLAAAFRENKAKVILGVRRNNKKRMPPLRRLGGDILSALVSLLFGKRVRDVLCGLRVVDAGVLPQMMWESSGYEVETEMLIRILRANFPYQEVAISETYENKYKGLTPFSWLKIALAVLWWRIFPPR